MPDWRSSAAYRIAFTYSAAFALVVATLGGVVYLAADRSFRLQQDAAITEESASLLRDYRNEGLGDLRERIDAREASHPTNAFGYVLLDGRGRRIAGSMQTRLVSPGWHDIVFQDPEEGPDPARALSTRLPGGPTLVVAADTEALEQIDHTILVLFGDRVRVCSCDARRARRIAARRVYPSSARPDQRDGTRRDGGRPDEADAGWRATMTSSMPYPGPSTPCSIGSRCSSTIFARCRATSPMICGRRWCGCAAAWSAR